MIINDFHNEIVVFNTLVDKQVYRFVQYKNIKQISTNDILFSNILIHDEYYTFSKVVLGR